MGSGTGQIVRALTLWLMWVSTVLALFLPLTGLRPSADPSQAWKYVAGGVIAAIVMLVTIVGHHDGQPLATFLDWLSFFPMMSVSFFLAVIPTLLVDLAFALAGPTSEKLMFSLGLLGLLALAWYRLYLEEKRLESLMVEFCQECLDTTTGEEIGDVLTLNYLFGTCLKGGGERCEVCGSEVKQKWLRIIVPVMALSEPFRILQCNKEDFYSRKLRHDL